MNGKMKKKVISSSLFLINTILIISLIFGGEDSLFATAWTSALHSYRLPLPSQSFLSSSSSWKQKRYCLNVTNNSKHTFDNNEPEHDALTPSSSPSLSPSFKTTSETTPIFSTCTTIPKELVQSLDLIPLLEEVAKYTSTKRGRDAILSLLGDNYNVNSSTQQKQLGRSDNNHNNRLSKRKSLLSSYSRNENYIKLTCDDNRNYRHIYKLSQSITECKEEWEVIREAMNILHLHKNNNNDDPTNHENGSKRHVKNDNIHNDDIHLPPIYPDNSSLWNTYYDQVDTDDDEWLMEILNRGGRGGTSFPSSSSSLELENILQADQLIKRILSTHEWCMDLKERGIAPMIVKRCEHIDVEKLIEIHDEIQGRVIIKKGGMSYQDPEGTKVSTVEIDLER